jgi:hypothetical protein
VNNPEATPSLLTLHTNIVTLDVDAIVNAGGAFGDPNGNVEP